jgi:hypothetical protein
MLALGVTADELRTSPARRSGGSWVRATAFAAVYRSASRLLVDVTANALRF